MAQIQKVPDLDARTLTIVFPADDVADLVCPVNDLPPISGLRLIVHGIKDKVGDSYSDCAKDYAKGRADAVKVWDQLVAGEWRAERKGGLAVPTVFVEAVQRVYGKQGKEKTVEDVKAFLARKTREERKALRSRPDVKAYIKDIEKERADAELAASDGLPDLED